MMRGTSRTWAAVVAIAAAGALLVGCSGTGGGTTDSGTVTIGATLPLTGFGAPYGKSMQEGLEIGLKTAEDNLGNGTKFDLIMTDSQAVAGPAVTEGRKLMADKGAVAVVTAFSAPPVAQLAIAEQYKVPLLNGGGNTPDLVGHDWLFNNAFMVNQGGYAMMKYAYDELGVKSIAIIIDSSYPESTVAAYTEIWNAISGEDPNIQFIPLDTTDAGPNIDKALATNPDAIFLSTNGAALSLVLNQLTQRNVNVPVLSNDGAILGAPEAATLPFPVFYANSSSEASPEFSAAYKAAYGTEPDFLALANYNIGLIIGQAVGMLQDAGKDVTGANLQAIFSDTSVVYEVDNGGTLSYNSEHFADQDAVIVKYEGGVGETIATGISTARN